MLRTMLCAEGYQLRRDVSTDEIGRLLADEGNLLWIDLERPTAEELRAIAGEFGFHPLAVEDAAKPHQRPKIDRYDDVFFIVFYDLDWVEEGSQIDEHELDIFVGKNFMVTVHYDPIEEIAEVAERFHDNTAQIENGVGVLLYSLLDTIVDHYFPVVDEIGHCIGDLERRVLSNIEAEGIQNTFALRKELITMRQVVIPQRDVMAVLVRRELPFISKKVARYFQDVDDHVIRVTSAIDGYRDLLEAVFDSHQSLKADSTNRVIKTMTAYSIILMSVTVIAGIYGMNFEYMPELGTPFGYPGALLAMLAIGLTLRAYFKRKGWL